MSNPMSSPQEEPRKPHIWGVWDEMSPEELGALHRVEEKTLQRLRERQSVTMSPSTRWLRAWSWALAGACTLAVVVWQGAQMWRPVPMTKLQTSGALQLQPTPQKDGTQAAEIHVPPQQTGTLQEASGRWRVQISGGSQLAFKRSNNTRSLFQLKQGQIDVHVKPNSMKQFAVQCDKGVRVVVTGTAFRVERTKTWMRVEVTRGHVRLLRESHSPLSLHKGQGVRVALLGKKVSRYRTSLANTLEKRLRWMAKHQTAQLFRYAWDIGADTRRTALRRQRLLGFAARLLEGQQRHEQAAALWRMIAKLDLSPIGKQAAEATSIARCLLARPVAQSCMKRAKGFAERFPGAPGIDLIYYRLAKAYGQRQKLQQAINLLQRYLKLRPKSSLRKKAQALRKRFLLRVMSP